MDKSIIFEAEIKQQGGINAAFVELPFHPEELFGKKGHVKIYATFDDKADYRGSLVHMGGRPILGLTQEIRKKINKTFGDAVKVQLSEDTEERIVDIPEDVQAIFQEHPKAYKIYREMSYTHRKEYMRWINDAKKTETREKRKQKLVPMILAGKKGI